MGLLKTDIGPDTTYELGNYRAPLKGVGVIQGRFRVVVMTKKAIKA